MTEQVMEKIRSYGAACYDYGLAMATPNPTIIMKERQVNLRNEAEELLEEITRLLVPVHRSDNQPAKAGVIASERLDHQAAINLLLPGEDIPILYPGCIPPVAWTRSQVLKAIGEHGVSFSDEEKTRQGFGLMMEDEQGKVWLGTRNSEVLAGRAKRENRL